MDVETKIELIKSEPIEEVITEPELKTLLETNEHPKHYIGLEISGMLHLGSLFIASKKINDLEKAGVKTQILLADWHTMANNKFGGDWDKIVKASKFYREAFQSVCPKTRIVLGSDLYKGNDEYWRNIIQMSRRVTMARATRTLIIEGRSEKETLHVSQYIYPIMQSNDIAALDVQIPHAGIDQRRVHVLAKELFKELGLGTIVPIHHHLLPSLLEPPKIAGEEKEEIVAKMKMSKSRPGSAILITATDQEVEKDIAGAWCPAKIIEHNPVLELCRYLILPMLNKMELERKREHGGDVVYKDYKELENDFGTGKLHPMDLKNAVAKSIIEILEPVRKPFRGKNEELLALFKE